MENVQKALEGKQKSKIEAKADAIIEHNNEVFKQIFILAQRLAVSYQTFYDGTNDELVELCNELGAARVKAIFGCYALLVQPVKAILGANEATKNLSDALALEKPRHVKNISFGEDGGVSLEFEEVPEPPTMPLNA